MKKISVLIIAVTSIALFQACSGSKKSTASDSTVTTTTTDSTKVVAAKTDSSAMVIADTTFAAKAAISGMAEVALGKMAAAKGASTKVKNFGQMMVTDHSKANNELMGIANGKNIQLPTSLDAEHQAKSDSLSKLSGKDFDIAYINAMIEGHKKTLALMQSEATNGKDAELKAFAAKTAPVVQMHLDAVQKIHDNMK